MDAYKHILVALDLSNEAHQVVERGRDLAAHYDAKMSLIHVVEPVVVDNSYDLMTSLPAELDDSLLERARSFLAKISNQLQLGEIEQIVTLGSTRSEIFRVAQEQAVDLIVIGTHGRHGVGLLLGSTANAILHGTPCDVHAIRIRS
jgi:universal stress protein A